MSGIIKNTLRSYIANQFLNIFTGQPTKYWIGGESVSTGDVRKYANNKYIATSTGTTGTTPPTHLSGSASDDSVTWMYVETRFDTDYYDNNLYVVIGRINPWNDDTNPDIPTNSDKSDLTIIKEAVFFKRIQAGNVRLAIKKNLWASGTVYSQYDENVENFNYPNPFYCTTQNLDVYKCISNNNGSASTSEPSGQSIGLTTTSDGYVWKYMASVNSADASGFSTNVYIPVSRKLTNDGSAQWAVQQNAKIGAISNVNVVNGGSDYLTEPQVIVIPSAGETITNPMTATATLNTGVIDNITITDTGSGYIQKPFIAIQYDTTDVENHQPTITINVDGSGGITNVDVTNAGQYFHPIANVTINTTNGAGAVLTPILDSNNILTGFDIDTAGAGYADGETITIDDGQGNIYAHDTVFDVIQQPKDGHGANVLSELNAKYIIIRTRLETDENGFFPTNLEFRRFSIVLDPIVRNGNSATAIRYYGEASPSYGTAPENDIASGTGTVIFTDNFEPVQRGTNQNEDIKTIIQI